MVFGFKNNLCDNGIRPAKFHAYVELLFMEDICMIFSLPHSIYIFAVQQSNVFVHSLDISVLFQMHVSIVAVYSIFLCLGSYVNKLLHLKVTHLYFSAKEIPLLTSLLIR